MINAGLLEMGHARALLGLSGAQQIDAAQCVVGKGLSVRDTEKLVQRFNAPAEQAKSCVDPLFERKAAIWKTQLSKKLSSMVNIQVTPEGKGRIVISFDSMQEAHWLMEHVGFTETEEMA